MKVGIIRDRIYLEHKPPDYHPESSMRLEIIYELLETNRKIKENQMLIEPRLATHDEVAMIHSRTYIEKVAETSGLSHVMLDPDTHTSSMSYKAALMAVGGILNGVDAILERKISRAFAFIRPPGHHAEKSRAMGFCIFNNVAIAANYLIEHYKLDRILIVDWDLHHGNGTQNAFYDDPHVLYFSTHQYPYYPGTGNITECGANEGLGFTVNVPLPGGQSNGDFKKIFDKILVPLCRGFKPQFILVSAGFDIHANDPLGTMKVTESGFVYLTSVLLNIAEKYCDNNILFLLEGGYHLESLKHSIESVVLELIEENSALEADCNMSETPFSEEIIRSVLHTHSTYWLELC